MKIWESANMLLDYCEIVPETTGKAVDILKTGILRDPVNNIPKPKCTSVGYLATEWLRHWSKTVPGTVFPAMADDVRRECIRLIKLHLGK